MVVPRCTTSHRILHPKEIFSHQGIQTHWIFKQPVVQTFQTQNQLNTLVHMCKCSYTCQQLIQPWILGCHRTTASRPHPRITYTYHNRFTRGQQSHQVKHPHNSCNTSHCPTLPHTLQHPYPRTHYCSNQHHTYLTNHQYNPYYSTKSHPGKCHRNWRMRQRWRRRWGQWRNRRNHTNTIKWRHVRHTPSSI